MKICTCENCRYTFRYPLLPASCPDCGKEPVRIATCSEAMDFCRLEAIVSEEIRAGLYGLKP